jgi:hypothetical protein
VSEREREIINSPFSNRALTSVEGMVVNPPLVMMFLHFNRFRFLDPGQDNRQSIVTGPGRRGIIIIMTMKIKKEKKRKRVRSYP